MKYIVNSIMIFYCFALFQERSYSQPRLSKSENPYTNLSGKYLGQKPPGLVPEIFAPGIISTDSCEFAITFAPDGKQVFFTSRPTYEGPGNRIFYTKEEKSVWMKPELAPFAQECVELAPFMSPDGKKIFFHSARPHPVTGKKMENDEKIWYAKKSETGWGEAEFLKGILNTGWVMGVSIAKNGNIYLCGEVEGKGGILKSEFIDGNYQSIEKICDGVHPYIAPDESFMVFDKIKDNMGEKTALYISYNKKEGNWSKAKRLNNSINSAGNESFGRVTADGKYLFFHRNGDIYWVSAKVLDEYK